MMHKVVFPIAKNKVVGVTKITDNDYKTTVAQFGYTGAYNINLWALTTDDYIVGVDRNTNTLLSTESTDWEFFCFICY